MHHKAQALAIVCSSFAMAAWLANYLELTWLRPSVCTPARMQLEFWLLFTRAASAVALGSNVLVVAGMVIALSTHRTTCR